VKVALTSNSLTDVDADCANARRILFYDVSANEVTFLDAVQFDDGRSDGTRGSGGGGGCAGLEPQDAASADAMTAKIVSLKGCGVLITRRLTDFAAVRIHDGNTFPVKMEQKREVASVLNQLQHLMNTKPPGWLLRKLVKDRLAPANGLSSASAQVK
jgi:nitrogen fixation protein NifX